jgi:shikimate dehydrogenase
LGIVGWPLKDTLSPTIHRCFSEQTGLGADYRAYPVRPGELQHCLAELASKGVTGLNVTYPHKIEALEICGRLSDDARLAGAVNTLLWRKEEWWGYNTDVDGFSKALDETSAEGPILTMGCGGVARAVALAADRMGIRCLVFCRRPETWDGACPSMPLQKLAESLESERGVLVNATPLGRADDDVPPLEAERLEGWFFFDLNYNPKWLWRNEIQSRCLVSGVRTGLAMLVYQAAESYALWTAQRPDTGSVLSLLRRKGFR